MPPAFNLSQDQTLQFDLFTSNSIDVGPIPVRCRTGTRLASTRYRAEAFFASCEHQNFLKCLPGFPRPSCYQQNRIRPGYPSAPAPTLIGCELLKSRLDPRAPPKKYQQRGAIIHQCLIRSMVLVTELPCLICPACVAAPAPVRPRRSSRPANARSLGMRPNRSGQNNV